MECMFPGSSAIARRFQVDIVELHPGADTSVAGVAVSARAADHPSGAPALALRLALGGKVIAYTGDTAWTDTLGEIAAGADLLIAEAYYRDKPIPYHLRYADIVAHQGELTSRRTVLTHMSADMLAQLDDIRKLDKSNCEIAHDGLVLQI
jgi:ribonuclease BN (tRNA processing enzyme)